MRTLGAGCLAGLWLGMCVTVAVAQSPGTKTRSDSPTGLWSALFGSSGSSASSQPKKIDTAGGAPALTQMEKATEQERLMSAYFRRMAVCDRLREIALETNNSRLEKEANRLESIAWTLYTERSNKLFGVRMPKPVSEDPEKGKSGRDTAEVLRMEMKKEGALPARVRTGGQISPAQASTLPRSTEGMR